MKKKQKKNLFVKNAKVKNIVLINSENAYFVKMEYCKSCHYNNNSKAVCDECKTNFYKSSNGNSYIEELFLIKEGISLFVQIMTMIMIVANAIVTSTIPKLEK